MGRRRKTDKRNSYEYDECDDSERISRCLNCEYPPECCLGEKYCLAQTRLDKKSIEESIVYARRQGYSLAKIAVTLDVSPDFVRRKLMEHEKGVTTYHERNKTELA